MCAPSHDPSPPLTRISFIPLLLTYTQRVVYIDKIIHRTYSVRTYVHTYVRMSHTFYLVSLLQDSLLTPRKLLGAAATGTLERGIRGEVRSRKNIRDI